MASRIVAGKTNVTIRTLAKLVYALGIDISDLFKPGATIKPAVRRGRPKVKRAK